MIRRLTAGRLGHGTNLPANIAVLRTNSSATETIGHADPEPARPSTGEEPGVRERAHDVPADRLERAAGEDESERQDRQEAVRERDPVGPQVDEQEHGERAASAAGRRSTSDSEADQRVRPGRRRRPRPDPRRPGRRRRHPAPPATTDTPPSERRRAASGPSRSQACDRRRRRPSRRNRSSQTGTARTAPWRRVDGGQRDEDTRKRPGDRVRRRGRRPSTGTGTGSRRRPSRRPR